MAKARVEVTCPTCGTKWTWSVDCHNRREADGWEARHEGEERECIDCWKETKRRERAEERHSNALLVEELVKEAGKELAPLVGTEKQVSWAEDIRAKVVCEVVGLNQTAKPELVDVVNLERSAKWWIDNARSGGYVAMELLWNEHKEAAEAIVAAAEEREDKSVETESKKENEE